MKNKTNGTNYFKVILVVNGENTIKKFIRTTMDKKQVRKQLKSNAKENKMKIEIIKIKKMTSKKYKKELLKEKKKEELRIKKQKKQELKEQKKLERQLRKEQKKKEREERKEQRVIERKIKQREKQQAKLEKKKEKMLEKLDGRNLWEVIILKEGINEVLNNKLATYVVISKSKKIPEKMRIKLMKDRDDYAEEQIQKFGIVAKEIPSDNWEDVLKFNGTNVISL